MENLDVRKQLILQAVICEYTLHAEPVGSRLLADHYNFGVGSATVRNEMSSLEEMGYLVQPHTSAGRIPTERGYRYYVNSIMGSDPLTLSEEAAIRQRLDQINRQVEEILQESSFLLSRLTNLVAVAVTRNSKMRQVRKIDVVLLEADRLLVVIVKSNGEVERTSMRLSVHFSNQMLAEVETFVNEQLCGKDAVTIESQLNAFTMKASDEFNGWHMVELANQIAVTVAEEMRRSLGEKVYYDGANFILGQPEFSVAAKAQSVFTALEERNLVLNLIGDVVSAQHVVIKIGSEIASLSADCSFVGAPYRLADGETGALGILGPLRMNYARAVAAVTSVAKELTNIV